MQKHLSSMHVMLAMGRSYTYDIHGRLSVILELESQVIPRMIQSNPQFEADRTQWLQAGNGPCENSLKVQTIISWFFPLMYDSVDLCAAVTSTIVTMYTTCIQQPWSKDFSKGIHVHVFCRKWIQCKAVFAQYIITYPFGCIRPIKDWLGCLPIIQALTSWTSHLRPFQYVYMF